MTKLIFGECVVFLTFFKCIIPITTATSYVHFCVFPIFFTELHEVFPALFAELSRRGWSEGGLAKLAGENLLRVMNQAETVARRLQRERGPSMATIERLDGGGGESGAFGGRDE